ncbi:MAG: D-glycero-beta-D-manno-heptose-7-phosphate kinase [Deltaproteobacteria bacterium]|nr:D-glycero-beta-D-manno-heptose-7-phosphate kinase [Deltaproteobacteria bacterium]
MGAGKTEGPVLGNGAKLTKEETLLVRLGEVLEGFGKHRVLVLGDIMLDEYLFGSAHRLSPEAPVPIVHVDGEESVLGGAGNVARNIIALGARCDLVGVVGNDRAGGQVQELASKSGLLVEGLVVDSTRPTSHKTRLLARAQQMIRFDREKLHPLEAAVARRVFESVMAVADEVDGALFVDYAKGTFSEDLASQCIHALNERSVPMAVDPKKRFDFFQGVDLVKPNLAEAEVLAEAPVGDPANFGKLSKRLSEKFPKADLAITLGRSGIFVKEAGSEGSRVGAWPRDVFDVQGAGDTTLASLWLSRLSGASMEESAMIANAAAGVVVEKVGTAVVSQEEIRLRLPQSVAAFLETE